MSLLVEISRYDVGEGNHLLEDICSILVSRSSRIGLRFGAQFLDRAGR
jgi:hypothetical protein